MARLTKKEIERRVLELDRDVNPLDRGYILRQERRVWEAGRREQRSELWIRLGVALVFFVLMALGYVIAWLQCNGYW